MTILSKIVDKLAREDAREIVIFEQNVSNDDLNWALRIARKTMFTEGRMSFDEKGYDSKISFKILPERQILSPIKLIKIEDDTFSDQSTIDYSQN